MMNVFLSHQPSESKAASGVLRFVAAMALAAVIAAICVMLPASAQQAYAETGTPMHRLYNPNSGEHFYTANTYERDNIINAGWRYEGVGWYAPSTGQDVYRLYNGNAGEHHYTLNAAERDMLVNIGWTYEGVGWKSGGSVPLYRQYNPNAFANNHNYTTNSAERGFLISLGWIDEGYAWWGVGEGYSVEDISLTREKVLNLTNEYRTSCGVNTVVLDDKLNAAAQARANELATSGLAPSHTRPNGTNWSTVLAEFGCYPTDAAENLCGGYTTAEAACQAWENSSGHSANMRNSKFKKMGVGVAQTSLGYYHWVQIFSN